MAPVWFTIKPSSPRKGRGAFASREIPAGTLLDEAHLILIPRSQYPAIKGSIVDEYTFELDWDDGVHSHAFPVGPGSFLNHSTRHPNVDCHFDRERLVLRFEAMRDITKGEELLVDYTGDGQVPLWFDEEDEGDRQFKK